MKAKVQGVTSMLFEGHNFFKEVLCSFFTLVASALPLFVHVKTC
jgi:hypothetical protein